MALLVLWLGWPGVLSSPQAAAGIAYRVEPQIGTAQLRERFTAGQLALLEKINRADLEHLGLLPAVTVPDRWVSDERAYTQLPPTFEAAVAIPKAIVVSVPDQMFGAYEWGELVRWGPVSTGAASSPTPPGRYTLTWKSRGHTSSVDPTWYLEWYFNFESREGLAFHQYSLPGSPGSHGCIRLLERDAIWLFAWGETWSRGAGGAPQTAATAVLIVGTYDFAAPPPWRTPEWLQAHIDLPAALE